MKKCVLVTGASGFIGRALVGHLIDAGYAVRATTSDSRSFAQPVEVAIVSAPIDTVNWKPILDGVDFVIHLAGIAHAATRDSSYAMFDAINRQATKNLALAANEAGVERFVFISSVRAQVGPSAMQSVREADEPRPTDDYGRSKLAAEREIRASGVPFTILRPVAVYGPHPKGNMKNLVNMAMKPFPLPAFTGRRSLLGIDNLISAILFVLTCQAAVNETYLVADAAPFTVSEIFRMLRRAQGRRPALIYFPRGFLRLALKAFNRAHFGPRLGEDLVVDVAKLKALGWRPAVGTYEGIVAMMRAESGASARQT